MTQHLRWMVWVLVLLAGQDAVATGEAEDSLQADRTNLALRRAADALLREAGDSTSRIPAIEQTAPTVWRIRLDQSFAYEALPRLLQESLDRHGISTPYAVAVRRCNDDIIDLGYHQLDWLKDSLVPCAGREMTDECHFIEVSFQTDPHLPGQPGKAGWLVGILIGGGLASAFFLLRRRQRSDVLPTDNPVITIGHSSLNVAGQILTIGKENHHLTYRETKLLLLFAHHPDQILQRDTIIQNVWADEGVLVGRSLDMFVSRLRKKLAGDPTVSLVAVHGLGYRLVTEQS